jgi:hypothetical protein
MAYTTINKSTDYFNTKLYTGNGSTQSITGVGFQPDWTWIKTRSTTYKNLLVDAVRGATKHISSNSTAAEITNSDNVTAFASDGFNLASDGNVNGNSETYASWNWKAGTAISGATVGLGTLKTYTGSVNTTAGFSVIKYTGNGTAGHQFPHGLGVAPKMIMVKILSGTSDWRVYHVSQGATKEGLLNTTDAFASASTTWNNSAPNSNSMPLGTNTGTNGNDSTYVAYCFTDVTGYSKMGSYTGNGNADGTFIYTGFKPAFVMVKRADSSSLWQTVDTKRDTYNRMSHTLFPHLADAESSTGWFVDYVSNGFKIRDTGTSVNASGGTYLYMTFAEAPLVGSNNTPCTAR